MSTKYEAKPTWSTSSRVGPTCPRCEAPGMYQVINRWGRFWRCAGCGLERKP
jgi:hypothetical protein